jgi:hypothetical protein
MENEERKDRKIFVLFEYPDRTDFEIPKCNPDPYFIKGFFSIYRHAEKMSRKMTHFQIWQYQKNGKNIENGFCLKKQ